MTDIHNIPDNIKDYIVFRKQDNGYWFYGTYNDKDKAAEVAAMVGGIACQVSIIH